MADRIQLLPDHIANQIAAGEVIQRPASAVKELLENAVDAGATEIRLLLSDAGKALVQVIDNGSGMSETDARLCFERHATSKIKSIEDLFHIRTMGFRGEALASIAAVAQVEMRTRRQADEVGTCIEIENSNVVTQTPVAVPVGTSISMKNLFFNVPARRNFLKSNASELRHIVEEFIRVAMAFPELFFSLTHNGQQLFHLEGGTLKQRVLQILGNNYATKLVAVKEDTDYLNIRGFVGKPETAKKTRGDQYFFVNNRFIRSPYLNHAVMHAFQDLVGTDAFPMYVLFIDLDPAQVDVNVHPTKQEIKFGDEKIVYAFVQAAVKHALAQFSITPTLDFELDAGIQGLDSVQKPFTEEKQATTQFTSIYQAFREANQAHRIESTGNFRAWNPGAGEQPTTGSLPARTPEPLFSALQPTFAVPEGTELAQIFFTYILVTYPDRFLLVHQQSAHERILYERFAAALNGRPMSTQRSLFPATIELAQADAVLLTELLPDLVPLGYLIEPFGKATFVIQGTPADVAPGNESSVLEKVLEQCKHFSEIKLPKREMLLRSVAAQQSIRAGVSLTQKEQKALIDDLFQCSVPNTTPSGKPVFLEFKKNELEKLFGK